MAQIREKSKICRRIPLLASSSAGGATKQNSNFYYTYYDFCFPIFRVMMRGRVLILAAVCVVQVLVVLHSSGSAPTSRNLNDTTRTTIGNTAPAAGTTSSPKNQGWWCWWLIVPSCRKEVLKLFNFWLFSKLPTTNSAADWGGRGGNHKQRVLVLCAWEQWCISLVVVNVYSSILYFNNYSSRRTVNTFVPGISFRESTARAICMI